LGQEKELWSRSKGARYVALEGYSIQDYKVGIKLVSNKRVPFLVEKFKTLTVKGTSAMSSQ
jgi:hypothetical protein